MNLYMIASDSAGRPLIAEIDSTFHARRNKMANRPSRAEAEKTRFKMKKIRDVPRYDSHVAKIVDNIRLSGHKRILISVHGGLRGMASSVADADQLYETILKDSPNDYYPIFVNWESSGRMSYWDHLTQIRRGERRKAYWTLPFYLVADIGRGIVRLPIVWGHQGYKTVKTTRVTPINQEQHTSEKLMNPEAEDTTIQVSIGQDASGAFSGRNTASWIIGAPFKIFSTPIVDIVGKSSWHNMVRRTKTVFRRETEFSSQFTREVDINYSRPTGPLSILMQHLSAFVKEDPSYRIVLVGHSMGSIILNELLRQYGDLPYDHIVFMAAACTFKDFESGVIPYLKKHRNTTFYNLTLHPNAEVREKNYLDLAPRGSLLEWLDDFMTTPETIPDRRMGKWNNFVRSAHTIPKMVRHQIHLKAFGINDGTIIGDRPTKHGHFNDGNVGFWRKEFWEPSP